VVNYPTRVDEFDLGTWGKCRFANWLHPQEGRKEFAERDIDWLAQFIKPGDSCVDIGAYNGDTMLPLAVATGANGEVVCYEPNPVTYLLLYENAKLNPQFAKVVCRNAAIDEMKGFVNFRYDPTQMNGGFFVKEEKLVKVRTERLDTYKFKNRLAFTKIDTEGQDAQLLEWYFALFRRERTVVQVERYPHLTPNAAENLWKMISDYGAPFLEKDWERKPLTSLPSGLCNIVVIPHA